jgi:hypothetical protein
MSVLLKHEKRLKITWTNYKNTITQNRSPNTIVLLISNIPENIQHAIFTEMITKAAGQAKITQCKPYRRNMESETHLGHIVVSCDQNTEIYKFLSESGLLERTRLNV